MEINPIILSIPIYFILIGVELIIQQFQKVKSYRLNDAITNISCGITDQVAVIFFKIISITIYQVIFQYCALFDIPKTWWMFIVLFVASDFCYYWAHRKSHEVNLFWLGHAIHHQSEDFNLSVALRQGALQVVFTFVFYLPLAIIGFDTFTVVLANSIVTLYQFWIHTESIHKLGWFEKIFNTPSHHRVHHGKDPKYIDKNYAGVFIIWDKMFGTYQPEEEHPTYGLTVPVNTWNPLQAYFAPILLIFQYMNKVRGFDKMRVLFKPPGWLPDYAGGFQKPQPVDRSSYRKFDSNIHKSLAVYVLVQYIITLLGTAVFLFTHHSLSLKLQLLGTAFIILSITNFGSMFEMKRWAYYSELFRLVIFPFIILSFTHSLPYYREVCFAALVIGFISFTLLIYLRKMYFPSMAMKPAMAEL